MAKRKRRHGRPKKIHPPKPRGGVTKFNEAMSTKIIELAQQGCTNEEIADLIGVHRNTLFMWKQKNLDLMVALKQANWFANEMVEASLFRRACGYTHPAEAHFLDKQIVEDPVTGEKSIRSSVLVHHYEKHYPPSEQAAQFWLTNRDPERWKREPTPSAPDPTDKNIVVYETEWGKAGEPSGGSNK